MNGTGQKEKHNSQISSVVSCPRCGDNPYMTIELPQSATRPVKRSRRLLKWKKKDCTLFEAAIASGDDQPPRRMAAPTISAKRRRRARRRNCFDELLGDDILCLILGFLTSSDCPTKVSTARKLHMTITKVCSRWRKIVRSRIHTFFGMGVMAHLSNLLDLEARLCVHWMIRNNVKLGALTYPETASYAPLIEELMDACGCH